MIFQKIGLTGKIFSLCVVVTFLGAAITALGIYSSKKVAASYQHVAKINLPNAEALGDMLSLQKDVYLHFPAP